VTVRYALLVYGNGDSAVATTLHRGRVLDGPATLANEDLGRVCVVEAETLDGAIAQAENINGDVTVEIRPVMSP
jgi:hypothetical protein